MLAGIAEWKREKRQVPPLASKPTDDRARESFGMGMTGLRAYRKYMRLCRECGVDLREGEGMQCAKCLLGRQT
jgi:hypothetical protein